MIIRIDVVFPEPLGPSMPYMDPRGISRSSWSTAVCPLKRLVTPSSRTAYPSVMVLSSSVS